MKRSAFVLAAVALVAAGCAGNVFALEVGNCFNDPEDFGQVTNVEMVDCTELHDNEVYSVWDMTETTYPGQGIAQDRAQDECVLRFDSYVGRDYLSSSLDIGVLTPTAESWDRNDDREVVCFLYDLTFAKLDVSARNSGL